MPRIGDGSGQRDRPQPPCSKALHARIAGKFMNMKESNPVTSRDYWKVALVALFWILVLLVLTETYNIPLGNS